MSDDFDHVVHENVLCEANHFSFVDDLANGVFINL
jgi:hypothetical protein